MSNCYSEIMQASLEQARDAKAEAARIFSDLGRVVGIGIVKLGAGYALKINLADEPNGFTVLPSEVDGVPTRVEFVGSVRKLEQSG